MMSGALTPTSPVSYDVFDQFAFPEGDFAFDSSSFIDAVSDAAVDTNIVVKAVRKRRQHRHVDAQRRRREKAAVDELERLTAPTRADGGHGDTRSTSRSSILEAAVAVIKQQREQLAVTATSAHIIHKPPQPRPNKKRRHDEREHNRRQQNVVTHETLFSSVFALSNVAQLLMNADTGVCLSINDSFARMTGVTPRELVGLQLDPPHSEWLTSQWYDIREDRLFLRGLILRQGKIAPDDHDPGNMRLNLMQLHRGVIDMFEQEDYHRDPQGNVVRCKLRMWMTRVPAPANSTHSHPLVTLIHAIGHM